MQERGMRNVRIEYLDQSGKPIRERNASLKKNRIDAPKKSWAFRHPLVSALLLGGAISFSAVLLNSNCEGSGGKPEKTLRQKSPEEKVRAERERKLREQIKRIRKTIEVQKKLIHSGWYEKMRVSRADEEQAEEDAFVVRIDRENKQGLLDLLSEQNRAIAGLQEEQREKGTDSEETNDEIAAAERMESIVQDRLNEMEIEETGLLDKSVGELELILSELDSVLSEEDNLAVRFDEYMYAVEQRTLIAKAIEEKKFWDSVLTPSG